MRTFRGRNGQEQTALMRRQIAISVIRQRHLTCLVAALRPKTIEEGD